MNHEQEWELEKALREARGIAWDTCHKIYILLDDEQVEKMRGYGYDPLITADQMTPDEMMSEVLEWFDSSCSLRFIESVKTDPDSDGFFSIVPQGFDWEEEEQNA